MSGFPRSRGLPLRRVGIALSVAALSATTACGSAPAPGDLESWLRADAAVAEVHAQAAGSRTSPLTVAEVTLRPDADADAFAARAGEELRRRSDGKHARIDARRGDDGRSIVADEELSRASDQLQRTVRERYGATAVRAFVGDVEVRLPDATDVASTFTRLAADADVARVASDGLLRADNGTDSLGKKGAQALDPYFLPAITAAESNGATSYHALMDRDVGPSFSVTADAASELPGLVGAIQGVGYWGQLEARAGQVSFLDRELVPALPVAAALSETPGVRGVELHMRRDPDPTAGVVLEADCTTTLAPGAATPPIAELIEGQGADHLDSMPVTYVVQQGEHSAKGTRAAIARTLAAMTDVAAQPGALRSTIGERGVELWVDADHPEQWGQIFDALRDHPWSGTTMLQVTTLRDGGNVESARFESTATGPSSVTNTGSGNAESILQAWDRTAR